MRVLRATEKCPEEEAVVAQQPQILTSDNNIILKVDSTADVIAERSGGGVSVSIFDTVRDSVL